MSGVTIGTVAAVVGAAAAVTGTAVAVSSANQADKQQKRVAAEQRKAQQAQARQQEIAQARERRNTVRTGRLARASAIQAGVESGAGLDSSRTQGATGSLQSQTAGNVSFLDTSAGLVETANNALVNASIFQSKANSATARGNTASAIAGLGVTAFNAGGGVGSIENIFTETGSATPTTV